MAPIHDLMPLDMAVQLVFRRVYEQKMQLGISGAQTAHIDGLAYTIAELVPIYVYEPDGHSVRMLSKVDLAGALFEDGAKAISFIDGRPGIKNLAVNVKTIPSVVDVLIASSRFGQDD